MEHGIWSDLAGGIIDAGMNKDRAERERLRLIKDDGEEADDLEVVPMCDTHEGQPKKGCEGCADEWEDDE